MLYILVLVAFVGRHLLIFYKFFLSNLSVVSEHVNFDLALLADHAAHAVLKVFFFSEDEDVSVQDN